MAPIDPRVESINLLRSIDTTLKALLLVTSQARNDAPSGSSAAVASDADLDGQYGDPEVRAKDPRDWSGPPMKGRHFSECPADYLDLIAERFDYFAGQETDAKKAGYNRKDAARARGWAKRIRAGRVPQAASQSVEAGFGEDFTAGADGGNEWLSDVGF